MSIHFLNTFTCNAHYLKHWQTGLLSLLVETEQGLVLVDTGLGRHELRLRAFGATHPEVTLASAHMFLDFFADAN